MKKLFLLIPILISSAAIFGQQAPPAVPPGSTIERVDLSGLAESRLSAELRADIQKLSGQLYKAETVEAITQDIQVELPEYVAAATTQPGSQPDRIRVVILVARISDNDNLKTNINSRYTVDDIKFEGIKVHLSSELNAELQTMVGGMVNSAQLDTLGQRISGEVGGNTHVTWKLRRSSAPQHVDVVYDVRKAKNTLSFALNGGAYHSRQGFSMAEFKMSYTYEPVGTLSAWMANTADPLIERYAGYGVGYSLGNRSFRGDLKYSSYRAQWKPDTLEADMLSPQSPGLYRLRDTLSGLASYNRALHRSTLLTASAGVEFVELQMQTPTLGFQKSNSVKGRVQATGNWGPGGPGTYSHQWGWGYGIAAGTGVLDSDFIYTRHEWTAHYTFTHQPHSIQFDFQAGRITGDAPMHERFSIGNARTLRGWNKYEINPLGGNRLAYGSAGYRYKIITGFYDVGSVWDSGTSSVLRQSAGIRLGKARCRATPFPPFPNPECFSVSVGFPINGGKARPAFILGMGF